MSAGSTKNHTAGVPANPPRNNNNALTLGGWFARWLMTAPVRWLGRQSSVGQDLADTRAGLTYLRHMARGNRIRRQAAFDRVTEEAPPVLLIHGFLGTRGSMFPLEQRLTADGLCVFSFNLGALNYRDIRRSAFLIHRKIESILSQTSTKRIDIIGHSMGGLIGLYYVKKLGGHERVRKLILMGSPVRGTWAALLGIFTMGLWSTSSWQLLPRSSFLDELAQGPLPTSVEIVCIAAARDWFCPPGRTRLRGAARVTVPMGHSSLIVSDEVYRRLIAILRTPWTPGGKATRHRITGETTHGSAELEPGAITTTRSSPAED
jgi:pimeloyl-ACP methyl ester carboxylesterase